MGILADDHPCARDRRAFGLFRPANLPDEVEAVDLGPVEGDAGLLSLLRYRLRALEAKCRRNPERLRLGQLVDADVDGDIVAAVVIGHNRLSLRLVDLAGRTFTLAADLCAPAQRGEEPEPEDLTRYAEELARRRADCR